MENETMNYQGRVKFVAEQGNEINVFVNGVFLTELDRRELTYDAYSQIQGVLNGDVDEINFKGYTNFHISKVFELEDGQCCKYANMHWEDDGRKIKKVFYSIYGTNKQDFEDSLMDFETLEEAEYYLKYRV